MLINNSNIYHNHEYELEAIEQRNDVILFFSTMKADFCEQKSE